MVYFSPDDNEVASLNLAINNPCLKEKFSGPKHTTH